MRTGQKIRLDAQKKAKEEKQNKEQQKNKNK